jgi:hypothetical protein
MDPFGLEEINRIKSVSERDIDILLLEEFNSNPEFGFWFLSTLFPKEEESECMGAWHSVTDSKLGESDLIILYESGLAILIENKIDAPVQPQQAFRYIERGEKGIKENLWKSFETCMVAPNEYLEKEIDAKKYSATLSYERIDEWFSKINNQRVDFKRMMLNEAIEQKRRGYSPETDENVTEFWKSYWEYCKENYPELEMKDPKSKPAHSDWPRFTPSSLGISGAVIIHKLHLGFADLSLPIGTVLSDSVRSAIKSRGALIAKTGKSEAIRFKTDSVNRSEFFKDQSANVDIGLKRVRELLLISREIL